MVDSRRRMKAGLPCAVVSVPAWAWSSSALCNLRKAGHTPAEARMKLHTVPRAPDPNPYLILQNRTILEVWKPYIPWNSE